MPKDLVRSLCLSIALGACGGDEASSPVVPGPAQVAEELLAADRTFSRAGGDADLVTALTAMFASGVIMPTAEGFFATGLAEATAALEADSANRASRVEWTPVRAGVSADGLHGFTLGYMTVHRPDASRLPLEYLAYWVKERGTWKVAAYKRGRGADGEPDTTRMPPALPPAMVPANTDTAAIAAHARGLRAAEQAFSDTAGVVGLGPAFAMWGSPDAVNMGGPSSGWIVGAEAIGEAVGSGAEGPSPVSWSADRVLVASSGDLGVTFGWIVPNDPPPGAPPGGVPFFTIWRRSGPDAPWRYVAE